MKKAFTMFELMICVFVISVLIIAMCRFGNTAMGTMAETSNKIDEFMSEYQDVLVIRATEDTVINNSDYFQLVEEYGNVQLWRYSGKYLEFYKLKGAG